MDEFTSKTRLQLYVTEGMLISAVGRAMCIALDQGAAVVCIATDAHRQRLERHLMVRGIDVDEARTTNQFICLDARETVWRLAENGVPDAEQFVAVIGDVVNQAAGRFPRVWIFGELIALMCADGHHAGAVELERIWTSFMASRPFAVLHCAYPREGFSSAADRSAFLRICDEQVRVLQSGSSLTSALASPTT